MHWFVLWAQNNTFCLKCRRLYLKKTCMHPIYRKTYKCVIMSYRVIRYWVIFLMLIN